MCQLQHDVSLELSKEKLTSAKIRRIGTKYRTRYFIPTGTVLPKAKHVSVTRPKSLKHGKPTASSKDVQVALTPHPSTEELASNRFDEQNLDLF